MNKVGMLIMGGLLILLSASLALGQESSVTREEVDALKRKLERLEKTIENPNAPASEPQSEKQWYEKIDFAIGASGVIQGSTGAEDDGVDATARYELELQFHVTPKDLLYLHLEAGNGDGIDDRVPTLSSLNADAFGDDDHPGFTEAWYLHRFQYLGAVLQIGKLCLGGPGDNSPDDAIAFDGNEYANNERNQFLSGGFVNSLALELPDNGLAVATRISPLEQLAISFAVADADADWSDLFNDLFLIAEVNFKPEIAGHPGNYRVYGWFNGSDHEDLLDPTDTDENNYGVGLSFDQEITESLGIFARYGWQRGSVSQVEHAWSAGFQCSGKFYGRENDTFGLAYGMAVIGDDWKDANSGVNAGDEHHVELYYNIKVNDHLDISPDIQWVNNPNGDRNNDDVWAFGIRAQLSF
jgi:hypothetical protein